MSVQYGSVPFDEQIAFMRQKLNIPTRSWTDIYGAEHDWAFGVAGATRDAIVGDFRKAVERAIEEGTTLETFRKDFDKIVARHGWDYRGGREWRSRTIYETNLYSSYGAGRLEQLEADKEALPYWQYHHSGSENPRHEHLQWDGLVLRADDPWWDEHYPPNGRGCGCSVTALSEDDLDLQGLQVGQAPPDEYESVEIGQRSPNGPRQVRVPKGVDPGFEHAPGRSRLHSAVPPPTEGSPWATGVPGRVPAEPLPAPRVLSEGILPPAGRSDSDYVNAFLGALGATSRTPATVRDVMGERVVVGREMFRARRSGRLSLPEGDPRHLPLLAEVLRRPDELWARIEWDSTTGEARLVRRYVARYRVGGEELLAVLERSRDGWQGAVAQRSDDPVRVGVRLYRRSDGGSN